MIQGLGLSGSFKGLNDSGFRAFRMFHVSAMHISRHKSLDFRVKDPKFAFNNLGFGAWTHPPNDCTPFWSALRDAKSRTSLSWQNTGDRLLSLYLSIEARPKGSQSGFGFRIRGLELRDQG